MATTFNQWEFQENGKSKTVEIDGNFETNNATALQRAARAGVGLIRTADFIAADDLETGTLKAVLTEFESEKELGIYAVYPHNRHLSPKVRVFIDLLVDTFNPK